jgi:hypothetical protein
MEILILDDFLYILNLPMFLAVLLQICQASLRNPNYPIGGPKNVISIKSQVDFCMFLPPAPNITIAVSEGYPFATEQEQKLTAVSYCTQENSEAPGHLFFYDDFILGAHFLKTERHVQVTGRINATLAGIPLDGGGYYDLDENVNSPPGGTCFGYDSFYNAVNPIDGIFCIKCCKGISACEIFNGGLGCLKMVPGDYSVGFDGLDLPRHGNILKSGEKGSGSNNPIHGSTPNTGTKGYPSIIMYVILFSSLFK